MTGGEDAYNVAKCKHLRNTTNCIIKRAKREFILDKLKTYENDAKKFWKVIRTVVPSDKSKGNESSGNILLTDGGAKVNKKEVDVSEKEVFDIVKSINISKSSGLDNVSSYVIKVAFKVMLSEVTHMYNLSIRTALYSKAWKKVSVVPIPKGGHLNKVQNYRPISLLPLPGKIMEKLVHKQLSNHLEAELLLTDMQHGFRMNHLTVDSVVQLTNFINKKNDTKIPTLAAYIDFWKAFDCV